MDGGVRFRGLDEVNADLAGFARDIPGLFKEAGKEAAERLAKAAESKARGFGGVRAKSAPAVTVEDSGDAFGVGIDGGVAPYAMGAAFGAVQYPQFPAYVGPDSDYFVAPSADAINDEVFELFEDAVDNSLRKRDL